MEKRQLFVLRCEDSLKLKGVFVDLLGSFQQNAYIVLSKICAVLPIDVCKWHQSQVIWFVCKKAM